MNSVVIATKRGIMDFQFLPVFQGLTEQELHDLEQIGAIRRQKFNKHMTVFHVGDLVHEIGIVLEGSVLIENNDLWGNKSILSRVEKGQVFAESYAFHEVPLMVDAIADEDSLICSKTFCSFQRRKTGIFPTAFFVLHQKPCGEDWRLFSQNRPRKQGAIHLIFRLTGSRWRII